MTDRLKKTIIVILVTLLIVLNIWRWWPTSTQQPERGEGASPGAFSVDDFEVKATPVDSLPAMSRDIFSPRKLEIEKHRVVAAPPQSQTIAQPLPLKSEEEAARDTAQAEFSQIQCVGISIRKDRFHAYLIDAGEPSLVTMGEKIGRFVIEEIVPEGVTLRDPETGVGGLVSVSGKK